MALFSSDEKANEIARLEGVCKTYLNGCKALQNVDLVINKGNCLGLVGESGSGKSTLARCLLTLEKIDEGEIWLFGQHIKKLKAEELKKIRSYIQVVFQNPKESFNSKLTMYDSLLEPIRMQRKYTKSEEEKMVLYLLDKVQLDKSCLYRYPRELSGGECQKLAIARAISVEPKLIVFDEPTASLDAYVQTAILKLLKDLQKELSLSYIFISHDLSVINYISNCIAVMQSGRILEKFLANDLMSSDRHPYTKQLVKLFV